MNKVTSLIIIALSAIILIFPSVNSEEDDYSFPPSQQDSQPYVPNEIIVAFTTDIQMDVACSYQQQIPFAEITTNNDGTLDYLFSQHEVVEIKPVFRQVVDDYSECQSVEELKEIEFIKFAELKEARGVDQSVELNSLFHIYVVTFSQEIDVIQMIEELNEIDGVEYAEPNIVYQLLRTPNDTNYAQQWAFPKIDAEQAWDRFTNQADIGKDVVVAVTDDGLILYDDIDDNVWLNIGEFPGVDDNNDGKIVLSELINNGLTDLSSPPDGIDIRDLFGSVFEDGVDNDNNGYVDDFMGWNFVNAGSNRPWSTAGFGSDHGTHVAGTIAAETNNNSHVAGMSWHSKVMPLRIFDPIAALSVVASSLQYAIIKDADVVNMSWGGNSTLSPFVSRTLELPIINGTNLGVILIAAAGNDNQLEEFNFPASYTDVIAVGATDDMDRPATFTTISPLIEVSAPGDNILSLTGRANGTSMASPHVAGLAALILSHHNNLGTGIERVEKVRRMITSTTDPLNNPTSLPMGSGRIDANEALGENPNQQLLARITSPRSFFSPITSSIVIEGTAAGNGFQNYSLDFVYYNSSTVLTTQSIISNQTTAVTNGTLATWNIPTTLPNAQGWIKLTVNGSNSRQAIHNTIVEISVVANNQAPDIQPIMDQLLIVPRDVTWDYIYFVNDVDSLPQQISVVGMSSGSNISSLGFFGTYYLRGQNEWLLEWPANAVNQYFSNQTALNNEFAVDIELTATDNFGGSDQESFQIILRNEKPELAVPANQNLNTPRSLNESLYLMVSGSDSAHSQPVQLSARMADGTELQPAIEAEFADNGDGTGEFFWSFEAMNQQMMFTSAGTSRTFSIEFTATDEFGATDSKTVDITLTNTGSTITWPF